MGKKKREEQTETSELVAAAVALIEAIKGANPEALAVAREAYDAILKRYSAGTEAMLSLLPDHDARPNS